MNHPSTTPRHLLTGATLLLVAAALAIGACGDDDDVTSDAAGAALELPGDDVFPEGVAVDKATGDFYVGSTTDGTIYRGSVDGSEPAEVFLPGGEDGRESVTGLKVDSRGRLFAAGRYTGKLFVYDAESGELIEKLDAPQGIPSFAPGEDPLLVNDLTLTEDAAYVTDSFRPVVYRVALDGGKIGRLEPWLDLEGSVVPYEEGFNLNGISASDDGRYLLTVHSDTGRLFRIETATGEVAEVDLGGETLSGGDGLLLDGNTLLAVTGEPGGVVPVELDGELLEGEVGEALGSEELDYPTTLAELDGRLLVVNSQFDAEEPELPFTVASLDSPLP